MSGQHGQHGPSGPGPGLIDHWLRAVKDTEQYFWRQLAPLDETARLRRLVELNVIEQVYNLGKTSIVQRAWHERQRPFIHGWVFDVGTGRIDPLTKMIHSDSGVQELCKFAHGEVIAAGAPDRDEAPAAPRGVGP